MSLRASLLALVLILPGMESTQAQLSRLSGIKIPNLNRSSSSSRADVIVPQVIRAVQGVQNSRRWTPSRPVVDPITVVRPPVKKCPPQTIVPVRPSPITPPPPPAVAPSPEEAKLIGVRALVAKAKELFAAKQYQQAGRVLDQVIKLVPEDADAWQFRSLTHFAQQDYDRAAADAYDAFQLGNAWTWPTLRSLYPEGKASQYTDQLRHLEDLTKTVEPSMSSHFLLAYHYIMLGHLNHAEKQLELVLTVNPEEPLSQKLLAVVRSQSDQQVTQK